VTSMTAERTTRPAPAMKDGIIKRGKTWSFVVREQDPETGKARPRWVGGFRTRDDAKAARDKARAATREGTYVVPRNVTAGEWLTLWLDAHAATLKPSTLHSYRAKVETYLRPALGAAKLQALSPSRLSKLWADLADHGGQNGGPLSPRTVEYTRAILRKACADAVVERILTVNPVQGSKTPRREAHDLVVWDGAQQRAFLAATESTRWGVVWRLALASGLRRGEMCALRWDAVDFDASTVKVSHSATEVGSEVVTTDTKTHEARVIALDAETMVVLRDLRLQQGVERLAYGPGYPETGLLFTWPNGARVLPGFLSKAFINAQDGLDLPRLTLHGCRHSHASTLLRAGIPVHVVAARLGHADAALTLRVYAHAIPSDGAAAAGAFTRALLGA
jgi:integrase